MKRTRFQQGLDDLKQKLLQMGGMAESAVEAAAESYLQRDPKLCQLVFERENAINDAERAIDELAIDLLAMQQPMAVDLRFIVAVLKINADMERVGDQAVNIVQRTMDLLGEPEIRRPPGRHRTDDGNRIHDVAACARVVSLRQGRSRTGRFGDGQYR